jgi:hypothetical protein
LFVSDDGVDILYNTFSGNYTTTTSGSYSNSVYLGNHCGHCDGRPNFNYNNFINEGTTYAFLSGGVNSSENLNAENNYWDTSTESAIQATIYDWNENGEFTLVDYSPYLSTPNTTAPISPPTNVVMQQSGSNVVLSWTANSESDVAGYKIHHGSFTGYSYATTVNAGNVTTHTLTGVSVDSSVSVTAYDGNANGTDDQLEGYESWFSLADAFPDVPTGLTATAGNASANENQLSYPSTWSSVPLAVPSYAVKDILLSTLKLAIP